MSYFELIQEATLHETTVVRPLKNVQDEQDMQNTAWEERTYKWHFSMDPCT